MKINNRNYRTIWPDPENSQIIRIIDQRRLPYSFVVEDLTSLEDTAQAIKDMHVRGAGLIGATAAFGMYLAALEGPEEEFDSYFAECGRKLVSTRPTAVNLAWAVNRQLKAVAPEKTPAARIKKSFLVACEIADSDAESCRRIGEYGLEIIRDISAGKKGNTVNILTHCNAGWLAFVDYGSATSPIYAAHKEGIDIRVWVDETRPWLQGAKLTTWELQQEGVPHTLISDNTGGLLMQKGMVDMVLVGSDRTTYTGDVANKIGTYLKALAAKDNNIPFYVALPSSTLDWEIDRGEEIPIEERNPAEVLTVKGIDQNNRETTVNIAPPGVRALNYGFDVTPARLVTALITEKGVVTPDREALEKLKIRKID
ncbi:MAG: S-methyl-5-thioribose-1-phosphate isomerase [Desulfurivibrionaceae bacterium]